MSAALTPLAPLAIALVLTGLGAKALGGLVGDRWPADLPADWPQRGALGLALCALAGLALSGVAA